MDVTPDHLDILQNIELTVVQIYREHEELADHNVNKVAEGLIRLYQAEIKGRKTPTLRFSELEQQLFEGVKAICEWRLGRESIAGITETDDEEDPISVEPVSLEIMIACLKRIRRSVLLWTKERGKRGYLEYIQGFLH
jgi:hypothetical protein